MSNIYEKWLETNSVQDSDYASWIRKNYEEVPGLKEWLQKQTGHMEVRVIAQLKEFSSIDPSR